MLHCGLAGSGLLICVNLKKLSGRVTRPCHLWGLVLSRLLASPLLSRWPKKGSCETQYSSSCPQAPSTWHFNHGHLQPISSCILAALSPSVNIVSWRDVCNPIQLIPLAGPIHQALQPWSSTANFFINLGGLHGLYFFMFSGHYCELGSCATLPNTNNKKSCSGCLVIEIVICVS